MSSRRRVPIALDGHEPQPEYEPAVAHADLARNMTIRLMLNAAFWIGEISPEFQD